MSKPDRINTPMRKYTILVIEQPEYALGDHSAEAKNAAVSLAPNVGDEMLSGKVTARYTYSQPGVNALAQQAIEAHDCGEYILAAELRAKLDMLEGKAG